MLEWLREHGVEDVIMSCGFLATSVREVLGDGSRFGVRLRFVEEPEPRGTAGAAQPPPPQPHQRLPRLQSAGPNHHPPPKPPGPHHTPGRGPPPRAPLPGR